MWKAIEAFEGYMFHTRDREQRLGRKFSYEIKDDLRFSPDEKSITKAEVEYAYETVIQEGYNGGRIDPLLYAMFVRFGVISVDGE